jgi:hypothetical protein
MNRQQRRAANTRPNREHRQRLAAIHEAGHAVGRVMVAEDMGLSPDKAVSRIETRGAAAAAGKTVRPRPARQVTATTVGPMFSPGIEAKLAGKIAVGETPSPEALRAAIAEARAGGEDIDRWLRSRLRAHVFGGAAEARFAGVPFGEVWASAACDADIRAAVRDARLADLTAEDANRRIDEAATWAVDMINDDRVWRAVQAVAAIIPAAGSVDGKQVAATAMRHLAGGSATD